MLILKNEIKEVFKTLGMPEGLTVSRNNRTKFVAISGQCGEPVLTITKVEIGAKLTKAEREILINDYIVPALTVNKKAVLDYIKLRKDTTVDDDLKALQDKYILKHSCKSWLNPQEGFECLSIHDNNYSIKYIPDEDVYKVIISNVEFEEAKKVIKKLLKVAKVVLPKYEGLLIKQNEIADKVSKSKSFLNEKCGF